MQQKHRNNGDRKALCSLEMYASLHLPLTILFPPDPDWEQPKSQHIHPLNLPNSKLQLGFPSLTDRQQGPHKQGVREPRNNWPKISHSYDNPALLCVFSSLIRILYSMIVETTG